MAQYGRNGHNEDNGTDNGSYIYNPMSYNYSQHNAFSPPTVLSQQDASLMADFFNNPDTSNPEPSYLGYNIDASSAHNGFASDSALANAHVQGSHVNYGNHSMPQARSLPVNMYEYSASFLQANNRSQQPSNNNNTNNSSGDAVAGASALLGLSTSQEQANLLGANSYMTWPNIVGAHLQAPMNSHTTTTAVVPVRAAPIKSNNTPQLPTQIQAPPTPTTSWSDIQAHEIQLRSRHPSLQLDTTNTHFPSHQQSWQNAPQSAAPHVGRRPPMVKFGSDNHFSPHGFTGPPIDQSEEKDGTLLHMAAGDLATDVVQAQRAIPTLQHRHSITGSAPIMTHPSGMVGNMSTPTHQLQNHFHGAGIVGNGSGRKRTISQVEPSVNVRNTRVVHDLGHQISALPDSADQRSASNNSANGMTSTNTQVIQAPASQPAPVVNNNTSARRRQNPREPRAPRQNLTDAQKRQNHIASEQKRRDTMKINYEILGQRVPAVRDGGAMSRSEILYHVANHLDAVIAGNAVMIGLAGITMQQLDDMEDSEDESQDDHE